jgi:5S rRNA maturation endonuclease (ribonuclease M5)
MIKKDLLNLLYGLGIQPIDVIDDWIKVSCPLADTNHMSKKDSNPSAGFKVNDTGQSVFHCFVCGTRSIESILSTFKWKKGVDLFKQYITHEVPEQKEVIAYKEKVFVKQEPLPVPDEVLQLFEPIENAKNYIENRRIDLNIAKEHGLLYCRKFLTHTNSIWENAVLVPIRDKDFKTYWIHYRSVDGKKFWHGKSKHFGVDLEWGREDSFFGIEYLDITKPVILVEGAFDVLRLKTLGLTNVIATHGGVSYKSKKLQRLKNLVVITGFDSDSAGLKFHRAVERVFNKPIQSLDWSIIGCKDPGEIKSKEDLKKVLQINKRNFKFQDKWRNKI